MELQSPSELVEIIDQTGAARGYLPRNQVDQLGLDFVEIEYPERYTSDPYLMYHFDLAYERGILTQGRDLNDVQIVGLASHIIRQRKQEEQLRERKFNEDMLINNAEMYKLWQEHQRKAEIEKEFEGEVEWRAPKSPADLFKMLGDFDEFPDEIEPEPEAGIDTILSPDDLEGLSE